MPGPVAARLAALHLLAAVVGCAAPPQPSAPRQIVLGAPPPLPDQRVPDYAKRPYEPFSRTNAVAIALREWRAFGSVVNDDPPDLNPDLPEELRPDRQPGLWQRVGDYWWSGQDAGSQASGWSSKYTEWGLPLTAAGSPAWSAAFVSYVMRTAGAGDRFTYSPLHADYINAASQRLGSLAAERPSAYAPQPGDLICTGRGAAKGLRFDDLPTSRFPSHCDVVVSVAPGQLRVVGGNVFGGVTLKHVPITREGGLAGPDGAVLDGRFPWFVVVRVSYDA